MVKALNRDKLLEFLSDFKNFQDILAIVYGINAEDMSLEHIGFMNNDEEFFNVFFEGDVMEAVRAISFGDYNYQDDYVLFNGYGNIDSYNDFEVMNEFIEYKEEIADRIIELELYEEDEYFYSLIEDCFE